ncbi:hypothetical protein PHET_04823 [Paragonimus heterotremus]|uniref:Uncharacterized protein n=1 Tax=Paragonimus heterotremus TaxID=100268 RepID=A0A8J4SMB1_9TREM|nr:hypothetical protein PHET_04823 [Paragonimus heterotremus]
MAVSMMKILFIINVGLALLLSIIALGVNPASRTTAKSDRSNAILAFNVIALILLIAAAVLYLILWFTCSQRRRIFIFVIFVLLCAAFLSFAISTGISYSDANPSHGAWLLSGTWMTIMAAVMSAIYYYVEPDTA